MDRGKRAKAEFVCSAAIAHLTSVVKGAAPLFEIAVSLPKSRCILRFLEPRGTCAMTLWQRLYEGTYDKPFVIDNGTRRFLHFDLDSTQSAMSVAHPDRLSLGYTRMMMAFLLFNRAPERILLLGLGGGSLAKFCYHRLPGSAVTAVEMNPHVIALRGQFCIPGDDERFRVIRGEGSGYVSSPGQHKDVILADACDRSGIAPELDRIEFYDSARERLSEAGVFVLNLCGERSRWPSHMTKIRRVFGKRFMTLSAREDGNQIVLAFRRPPDEVHWDDLEALARELSGRFGLAFPRYVRHMALDWTLRRCKSG
jgi:spermidine synthase